MPMPRLLSMLPLSALRLPDLPSRLCLDTGSAAMFSLPCQWPGRRQLWCLWRGGMTAEAAQGLSTSDTTGWHARQCMGSCMAGPPALLAPWQRPSAALARRQHRPQSLGACLAWRPLFCMGSSTAGPPALLAPWRRPSAAHARRQHTPQSLGACLAWRPLFYSLQAGAPLSRGVSIPTQLIVGALPSDVRLPLLQLVLLHDCPGAAQRCAAPSPARPLGACWST